MNNDHTREREQARRLAGIMFKAWGSVVSIDDVMESMDMNTVVALEETPTKVLELVVRMRKPLE